MNPKPDSGGMAATLSPEQAARQPRFTYSTGDRPLDGYTIKRGIGSGGFGEVYYATSDGGKEVALKLVQRNLDIELRGVGQCLNLKHANLVVLYDVKQSDVGDNWVVMEYVTGDSLAELIGRNPIGLAADRTGRIKSVGFGPDPTQMVVAHWQGVELWDANLRRTVCRFAGSQPGHLRFAAATISPDGGFIATGHDDGTVRLWEVPAAVRGAPRSDGHEGASVEPATDVLGAHE